MNERNDIPARPVDQLFAGRREAIAGRTCIPAPIGCGGSAVAFDGPTSEREFLISGLCQECQNAIFDGDDWS